MSYQAASSHYVTSSLSHPANSPFGRSGQQQLGRTSSLQQTQVAPNAAAAASLSSSPLSAAQSTYASAPAPQQSFSASGSLSSSLVQPLAPSPFSVRPELDPLEREKREIERRRQRLEDRKNRILHAKTRVMGVDVDSLNEQVRERQDRERLEAERDAYHDELRLFHGKTLTSLEEERKVRERIRHEEVNFYRQQQAQEKRQRELKEASGVGQLVDSNTPFLKFVGEDREKYLRDAHQKEQQKDWIAQQLAIQADREARERQDEADYALEQARILEMKKANEAERARLEKERLRAVQEYNQQQYAQKQNQRARFHAQQLDSNNSELSNTLNSDLLNQRVATSALGPHRAIPYHFKGMTPQQRQAILDEQYAQQQELAQKRMQQRLEEKDAADQSESIRREMLRQDRARDELERQRLLALKDERLNQAKQKTLRDQYLNHVVYTNPVKEEFFQQFGTSAR